MTGPTPSPDNSATRTRLLAGLAIAVAALALARWSHVDRLGFALGWVAFVPWLAVLDRAPTLRAAARAGWVMSVAFVLAVFGWFAVAVHGYTGAPLWLAYLLLALAAPLLQPQFLLCAVARRAVPAGSDATTFLLRTAVAAGSYVGAEWAWPKLLGDTVGYGFWIAPVLRQAADAIGVHGLTFVLLVVNECVLAGIRTTVTGRRRARDLLPPIACALGLLAALAVYGTIRLRQLAQPPDTPSITVAAIQAGLGDYRGLAADLGTYGAVRTVLDAHFALSQSVLHEAPALLVWPETIYPTTFGTPKSEQGAAFDREIGGLVSTTGVPLVFGAYEAAPGGRDGAAAGREFNAAIVLERDAAGELSFDAYRKAKLFPLTEQVPAFLDGPTARRWLPWLGTWQAGESASVLNVTTQAGPIRIAPLICYDAVDPHLARQAVRDGAQLLVTMSNDAWFASGDGPLQHFVVAGFRSIETRTPQVRATTTGISAIVDATGATLARAEVGERAALVARVTPAVAPRTLLLLWGDWFAPTALVGAGALLILSRWRSRHRSITLAHEH